MPTPVLNTPMFTTRVPFQFLSADAPSLNVTGASNLANNPVQYVAPPGNVGKVDLGINGTSYFRGDGEFAPFALELDWNALGIGDYKKLAALRPYLITFIDIRNNGYYGKLMMGGPKSVKGTADLVATTGTFCVLAPSDAGSANAVSRIATPTTLAAAAVAGPPAGYIAASSTFYYWLTFSSIWGETNPQASGAVTSGGSANASIACTWTWPSATAFCTYANLYISNVNDPTTAKLLAQVLSGDTAAWTDLVGYNGAVVLQTPPTVNTAYRGTWNGALWSNEP